MYLSTSRGIEKLFAGGEADPLLADALDVFGGNLTCCRLGHPGAQPCDREALVRPMLGLFYEIYRDRHGSRKKAWEVLEPRLKKLYPKDFDWVYFTAEGETLVERAPLFGDLIDATRAVVDLEKRGGGRNLDSSKGGTLCENQKFTVRSTPARWRGDAGSSLLDRERSAACTRHTG